MYIAFAMITLGYSQINGSPSLFAANAFGQDRAFGRTQTAAASFEGVYGQWEYLCGGTDVDRNDQAENGKVDRWVGWNRRIFSVIKFGSFRALCRWNMKSALRNVYRSLALFRTILLILVVYFFYPQSFH